MKELNVDFVIRYEHKVRELESIMLIKMELERRGYSVALTANYDYFNDKRRINPHVVISPALYNDNQFLVDFLRYGFKKKFANLLWEQLMGIREEEDPNGEHNIYGIGQRIVAFCWGENTRNRLIKTGLNERCAKVVGQINTDYLRKPLSNMLYSKKELGVYFNLDANNRWNLFISSFAYCELDDIQRESIKSVYGEKYLNEFTELSNLSRTQILTWIEEACIQYPNDIFIYRPHPDEARKSLLLKELENKYSNFKVIADYSIKHWINASDKVYNWYSTGIVDAYFLEKPIRLLRPCLISEQYDYRIFFNHAKITNREEFLNDYYSLQKESNVDKHLIKEYFYNSDRLVYLAICDILEEIYNSNKYDINYSIIEYIKFGVLYFKRKVIDSLYYFEPVMRKLNIFKSVLMRRDRLKKDLMASYNKNVASVDEILELENKISSYINVS